MPRFQAPNPTNNMPRFQVPNLNNMPPFQPANPNISYLQPQHYQNQSLPTNIPMQIGDLSMVGNRGFPSPGFHQPQPQLLNMKELIEKVDRAVVKAWRDLIAAGESVTAWKVSQSALLMLQIDNWGSLGFQMQQVPSLRSLILIEGKVMFTEQLYFVLLFFILLVGWWESVWKN